MAKQNYTELEKFKKEDVRFRLIIFGLLKTANDAYIDGDVHAYKAAVMSLEQNLVQYATEEQLKEFENIKKAVFNRKKHLKEECKIIGKTESELYDYEINRIIVHGYDNWCLAQYAKLYRKLMILCHKRNLLLDIEIELDAKGEEDVNEGMEL